MIDAIKSILKGIDQTEIESPDGWWETSEGARFGAKKLRFIIGLLKQAEKQEPVATVYDAYDTTGIDWHCKDAPPTGTKLYTTPPQRTWVGLTDAEIDQGLLRSDYAFKTAEAWRAGVVFAMTKLKEKNT